MTSLTSPSQERRHGKKFTGSWKDYLRHMITYNPDKDCIVIALDEEGNNEWELCLLEANAICDRIKEVIKKGV